VIALVALVGCGPKPAERLESYPGSLFALASGFAAKETCSCRFVSERSAEDCAEWVRVSPDVARVHVDEHAKVVTARALVMGKAVARFVDDRVGCVLDPR
jgi:hypothetical protein